MHPGRYQLLLYAAIAIGFVSPSAARAQVSAAPAGSVQTAGAAAPATPPAKGKGKKDEYTGPNTVIELPPAPMLDEEGKQRLDPVGKPMFNAPVRQQRDKKSHPLFDEAGKPVMQTATELGYDEHGKKLHAAKVKAPKMTPVSIARGTFSVDGMTARAALNYEIADFKYIYLFAPGIGIAVVSNEPFAGATEQAHGFNGNTLTVAVGEHVLQLATDGKFLGKGIKPAFVLVDRKFTLPSMSPEMGYGTTLKPPYTWPGARPNAELAGAPPVPVDMLPTQLMKPCPAGQMRRAAPKVLPGQVPPPQPCMPITAMKAAVIALPATARNP